MEENQSLLELEVDNEASANLTEVSKWGKFLAIIVLVALGMIVLLVAFIWSKLGTLLSTTDDMPAEAVSVTKVMIVIALLIGGAIVGVLMSFLIKGANQVRYGVVNKDQVIFNSGLANLKNYFVMSGILGILGLLFSLLGFLSR
jgi:hypothetical protein